ncbi:hypothetical protein C7416_102186 [Cupriavidus phytorum]|uniref:Uncharacterized protein n=1 Tax=Cupriavidus phytorum TaxID=3024399 RepID=A0A2W7P9X5_9BURK|nr:hypothetical protein [Cupriavidus alkaliphilus]PZX32026.1 hypothetical protein C7416_102186 [Cupriavidus alkaliphilus]
MKLSERLFEIFDAQAAVDRRKIADQADDLDTLGAILAPAHYAGVEFAPERIHACGHFIHVSSRDADAALAWLLGNGFSLQKAEHAHDYTHNHLVHARLRCPVIVLTDPQAKEQS